MQTSCHLGVGLKLDRTRRIKSWSGPLPQVWITAPSSISNTSVGHSSPVVECLPDRQTSWVASGHVHPCCILLLPSSLSSGYTVRECSTVHTTVHTTTLPQTASVARSTSAHIWDSCAIAVKGCVFLAPSFHSYRNTVIQLHKTKTFNIWLLSFPRVFQLMYL